MIGLVLSLLITLIIIGCYMIYRNKIVKEENTGVPFSELKQVKDIKGQIGNIFNF